MSLLRKARIRSAGGLIGVVVAVAGGFGTAVGIYSLPDLHNARVGGHAAYAHVTQTAVAASTLWRDEFSQTILHIEVSRGARSRAVAFGVEASDQPNAGEGAFEDAGAGVFFHAEIRFCGGFGCEPPQQEWNGTAALDSFQFDPLMQSASFSADVEGCRFDLVWHPEGAIAPFEHHDTESWLHVDGESWHARASTRVFGFAELSRVAPSDISMTPTPMEGSCAPYARQGAPGYLSQGAGGEIGADLTAD